MNAGNEPFVAKVKFVILIQIIIIWDIYLNNVLRVMWVKKRKKEFVAKAV